jgi:hypothetical protein
MKRPVELRSFSSTGLQCPAENPFGRRDNAVGVSDDVLLLTECAAQGNFGQPPQYPWYVFKKIIRPQIPDINHDWNCVTFGELHGLAGDFDDRIRTDNDVGGVLGISAVCEPLCQSAVVEQSANRDISTIRSGVQQLQYDSVANRKRVIATSHKLFSLMGKRTRPPDDIVASLCQRFGQHPRAHFSASVLNRKRFAVLKKPDTHADLALLWLAQNKEHPPNHQSDIYKTGIKNSANSSLQRAWGFYR